MSDRKGPGEAEMTITMKTDLDLKLAEISEETVIPGGGSCDPMRIVEESSEVSVPVSSLVAGFQLRQEGTDAAHVRLLADAAGSVRLPPILVQKNGSRIIDGMHRVEVAKLRGQWDIRARIIDCTDEEALVLAVKSNTLHGLPLSRADRISGAQRILTAHPDWSDRSVAAITGLSAKAIVSLRNNSTGEAHFNAKRLGRDGKRRPVIPAEGRRRAAEYIRAHPDASLREIARAADVSLGMVHGVKERMRREAEATAATQSTSGEDWAAEQAPCRPVPVPPLTRPEPVQPTHHSPVRVSQSARGRHAQWLAWSAISAKLAADPALRYTEGGRAFLRWMSLHSMHADEWRKFIDAIPQHWLRDVSRIAASMSEEWRQFAERLDHRVEAVS